MVTRVRRDLLVGIAASATVEDLYLHNRTQRRSLYYYGQLVRVQQVGLAIRLAESHPDSVERAAAKNKVIDQILEMVKISNDRDTAAIAGDTA